MNAPEPTKPTLLLDACCLLNLFATGHIEEILKTLAWHFAITTVASTEAMWVYRGGGGDDASERDPVDVRSLMAAALLAVLEPETDQEIEDFVALAAVLDDGEAMTAAVAIHRSAAIATDDRKARRVISARAVGIRLLSTTELLHTWGQEAGVDASILMEALGNVRTRAHFLPPSQDPLRPWWDATSERA